MLFYKLLSYSLIFNNLIVSLLCLMAVLPLFSFFLRHFDNKLFFCIRIKKQKMKLLKLLFVVVALLSVVPCFGKQIPLRGKWEKIKKSISIDLPMDATIEEGSKELILNFHEDIGFVYVMITDPIGGETYNEKINTDEISILVIPLSKQENGILSITDGQNHLYGEFINN